MTRLIVIALLVTTPVLSACSPPITVVTRPGQIGFTADQIAVRVNELEATAIQANATGALTVPTTRIIVKFTVSADKILATTPAGWQKAVATAWTETKKQLPPAGLSPNVTTAIAAVDLVLAAFLGG